MESNKKMSLEEIKAALLKEINIEETSGPATKIPESPVKKEEEPLKEVNIDSTKVGTLTAGEEQKEEGYPYRTESIVDKVFENENSSVEEISDRTYSKAENGKYKNTYIYGFIFIIGALLLEVVGFIRLGIGIFPTLFGIELAIILMLAGVIFIVPTEVLKIITMSVFLGIQMVITVINGCLYKVMHELVTIDMIFALNGEAVEAFEWSSLDWLSIGYVVAVIALVVLMIILGNKLMPKFKMRKTKTAVVSLILLLMCVEILGFSTLKLSEVAYFANAEQAQLVDNNKYLYSNPTAAKYASLKRFGFWGFYSNSLINFINNTTELDEDTEKELKDVVNAQKNFKYSNSVYNGANVSGALSGDNLIVIMMESIEWFAIDPFNTPTLYTFLEDSCVQFTNFYSNNKTNISEQISILGNSPYEKSFNLLNNTVGINVPNSLPNIFKQGGYERVNFFHDYKGGIYQRNIINEQLGFDNVYALEQAPLSNKSEYFGDFVDDGDFIDSLKEEFMPQDKSFFSFFTTVTTHGPYEQTNERYEKYYDRFENTYSQFKTWAAENNLGYDLQQKGTPEYKILKEYKSKAMAVDHAIEVILNYLQNNTGLNGTKLIDNTSIVLFADHNCYYSDLGFNIKNFPKYSNTSKIYNIPFAIYNKKLSSGKVDTFCTTFDIYPTICDLYGMEFNKSLMQGNSVFSNDIANSVFVSNVSGIYDDKYFTRTLDDYTAQDNLINTGTLLQSFKQKVNNFFIKQEYIELYYAVNYEKNIA